MLLNPIHFHFILTFPHCFSKSHRCGTLLKMKPIYHTHKFCINHVLWMELEWTTMWKIKWNYLQGLKLMNPINQYHQTYC
jgi:hypothetical protein